jgi:predicted dehydrogenase
VSRHGFGIIGAGVIAQMHAEAIAGLAGARLVAVTDIAAGQAAALAARHRAAAEPGPAALLARDDIDVVCVCVPTGLHAELGMQAAAAGKHLVVEKPIDVSLAAADQLIAAARVAGVALTVISQHRFDPGVVALRRLLEAGALGRLVLGEARTKWYRSQAYYDSAGWRGTWALDGGALMNQGIHYADLLRWSMGPVAEVTAVCATTSHQMEAEDIALALLRFGSGAVGTLSASTAAYPGFAQRLEISGTGGTAVIEDGELILDSRLDGARGPGHGGQDRAGAGLAGAGANAAALGTDSHAAQLADLLDAIDAGRAPAVTGQDGRAALEIVCAAYESAREGRTVQLPGSGAAVAGPGTSGAAGR